MKRNGRNLSINDRVRSEIWMLQKQIVRLADPNCSRVDVMFCFSVLI